MTKLSPKFLALSLLGLVGLTAPSVTAIGHKHGNRLFLQNLVQLDSADLEEGFLKGQPSTNHLEISLQRKIKDHDALSNDLHQRKQQAVSFHISAQQDQTLPQTKVQNLGQSHIYEFQLQPVKNTLFWGTVSVGNPPIEMKVDFDTGSTNMWIVRTCEGLKRLGQPEVDCYDPQNSNTSTTLKNGSVIKFGKGGLSGPWGQDTLWVGDQQVPAQHMAFAQTSDAFSDGTGILMGLGFPAMAAYNYTPMFDHLMSMHTLPQNLFSFWLSLNEETPSQLLFGKVNAEKFEGDIQYFPVVDKQFWTIELLDVLIGGKSLGICSESDPCYVAIDSGTSFMTFPPEKYQKAVKQFPHLDNCNNINQFEDITFVFANNQSYNLNSGQYVKEFKNAQTSQKNCLTIISPLSLKSYSGKQIFLLGDTFMQKYYTVFDRDNDRVGFAKAIHQERPANFVFDMEDEDDDQE